MNRDKLHHRIAAAKRYDNHSVDPADGQEVAVEVEAPLSAILQIRLEPAPYAKLKHLAKKRGIPITSMANKILTEALDESQT